MLTGKKSILFDNEFYDSSSAYDTSTGKFTPQVAGKYFIGGMINIQGGTSGLIESHTNISKNASTFSHAYQANQNNYSNYQTNYIFKTL